MAAYVTDDQFEIVLSHIGLRIKETVAVVDARIDTLPQSGGSGNIDGGGASSIGVSNIDGGNA